MRTLRDLELDPPSAAAHSSTIPIDTSLHYALSKMLAEGTTRLDVVDENAARAPMGSVRLESITELIAPHDPVAPEAR